MARSRGRNAKNLVYSRIQQRHQIGEEQEGPETDMVGLFYDLFFVGVAYNLGHMVLDALAVPISILYFAGLFFPCLFLWFNKLNFDSRFTSKESLYRRALVYADVCLLATAALHIDTLEVMRDSSNVHMFAFCISIMLSLPLTGLKYLEVYLNKKSSTEAKHSAAMDLISLIVPFSLLLAATISAGVSTYAANETFEMEMEGESNTTENSERMLEEETNEEFFNDFPVILCLCAFLSYQLYMVITVTFFIEEVAHTPFNHEYLIDRIGEWIMLMIGESVLSLVIVHVESTPWYYFTFFSGVLTMTSLQYVHSKAGPSNEENHAMYSKRPRVWFTICSQWYSLFLVAMGVAYKMMISEFGRGAPIEENFAIEQGSRMLEKGFEEAAPVSFEEMASRRERVAEFFCATLVFTLFFLDMMAFTHEDGLWAFSKQRKFQSTVLLLLKVAIYAISATMFLYTSDPIVLAPLGYVIVNLALILRMTDDYIGEKNKPVSNAEKDAGLKEVQI